MKSKVLELTDLLQETIRLFKRTLHWILAITSMTLIGIACYTIFFHDKSLCLSVLVLASGLLVALCALCWLGYCCKQLLGIYSESNRKLSDTELTLYQEAVRRERSIQDNQTEAVQQDPEIAVKRKDIELAKLEKQLQALK